MGSRFEVEINIGSAINLKNVNWRNGPLKPYVVLWIDPKLKCSTCVDENGDTDPTWDQTLILPFSTPIEESTLFIDIVHVNAMPGTKPLIGSAQLPLSDVVREVRVGGRASRKLELRRPSGRPQGKIDVNVNVRQGGYPQGNQYPPPHFASPAYGMPCGASAPPTGGVAAAGYAAPPSGYPAYGGPEQRSIGQYSAAAPVAAGAAAAPAAKKKKSKFGGIGGMGAGLAMGAVAGALGAVAISEGGADYVEDYVDNKIDEGVQQRLEEEEELEEYDSDD